MLNTKATSCLRDPNSERDGGGGWRLEGMVTGQHNIHKLATGSLCSFAFLGIKLEEQRLGHCQKSCGLLLFSVGRSLSNCWPTLRILTAPAARQGRARRGETSRDAALLSFLALAWPALPVRSGPVRFGSARSAVAHHVTCQPNEILHRIHMAHRVL